MDYKVLYRKYRPDDFSSIIGQDYMVSILKNSIEKDKISHAYIFSGPRGTGKTSTAKVFAKAINCLNISENGPCNECESCKNFNVNSDIIEIDAASNNGVDEIREIINNIKLAPAYAKYKVYIIDEVHMLSTSAFNALLLTLEEPPKHIVFILATTNIEAVPITILSRCQRFDFHKIEITDIKKRLEYVIESENIEIESEALDEIAYISDGGLRDALSILDQLSSSTSKITLEDVIRNFGAISQKQISEIYESLLDNNVDIFVNLIDEVKKLAIDYKLFIKKMLEKIETEAILSKKQNNYKGLEYKLLKEMAFELAEISNYVSINIDPYLLIELTLLKYIKEDNQSEKNISQEIIKEKFPNDLKKVMENNDFSSKSISREINEPDQQIISQEIIEENSQDNLDKVKENADLQPKNISREIFSNTDELINIRVNNCFVNAKKENLENIRQKWPEFINSINDKTILNLLVDSSAVAASDNIVIISNNSYATANLINENLPTIEETFNKKFNASYKFIALNEERWKIEKQTYIENIKNKVEYKIIEEKNESVKEEEPNDGLIDIALNIFDKNKIEID